MVNGDEEDGNGRGRPRSETYHQEVFEYSSSHHPSLHFFFFFFLDLISIEIQPIFDGFSSSRIDLSAVGDSAEENTTTSWQMYVPTHIKECDVKERERDRSVVVKSGRIAY